ncbi:hypothetical protein HETIRDRAFT_453834 [Heterobasidion irregulare TC 32-1]|uniref:Uncharacterized protein n=1 Tax=Heterobasidion irregulare (strain TC 32-1) TaxID=747525 RepID=W4JVW2_HETIT|nr:uncharacterized protein HETIRDRAFT_453834 [Heterobasidion irregulare TC 32-1]ETW77687.1 hypothetical protein HETIRDRAFT_453834 [Heterobasidion irregulare TC 32-1]
MSKPRPILKRSSHTVPLSSPPSSRDQHRFSPPQHTPPRRIHNVRFPPSPTLTHTFSTHAASSYDRSPIVVLPNTCALPARGCPGRTYLPGDAPGSPGGSPDKEKRRSQKNRGKHVHPRAAFAFGLHSSKACDIDGSASSSASSHVGSSMATPVAPVPSLIPDLSSESDESDGFISPPPGSNVFTSTPIAMHSKLSVAGDMLTPRTPPNTDLLSFLPYTPSSSQSQLHRPEHTSEDQYQHHTYEEERRRRREREKERDRTKRDRECEQRARLRARDRDSSRDLERQISGLALEEEDEGDDDEGDDDIRPGRYKTFGATSTLAGFSLSDPDDGCLGGF